MSKQIENFMKSRLEEEFAVREEYLETIEKIRKEKFKKLIWHKKLFLKFFSCACPITEFTLDPE